MQISNVHDWPLWHWHIEISSICALQCPRCSRTEVNDTLVNTQLYLSFFQQHFNKSLLENIKRISFCGYDGDPIYAKDFISVVAWFKQQKPDLQIYLVTNGSYRDRDWWRELFSVLNCQDQIHFSIDGWDHETNSKYRINSDWDSIMTALDEAQKYPVYKVWDVIYFDFNYQHINKITSLAQQFDFDQLRLTKSTKFGSHYLHYKNNKSADNLEPPLRYISNTARYQPEVVQLSKRINPEDWILAASRLEQFKNIGEIIPLCMIGTKGLFIDSRGNFFPCCWIVNRYDSVRYHDWLAKDYNIHRHGMAAVLNHQDWVGFKKKFTTNPICQQKCHRSLINEEIVKQW